MEINSNPTNLTAEEIEQLCGDTPAYEAPRRRNRTEGFDNPGVVRLAGTALDTTVELRSDIGVHTEEPPVYTAESSAQY